MTTLALAALLSAGTASAGAHKAAEGGANPFREAGCTSCHRPEDFAGFSEERLLGAIRGVVAGDVASHPELGEVSDAEIAALARFLAAQ